MSFLGAGLAALLLMQAGAEPGVQTRAEEIEKARRDKQANPPPPETNRVERALTFVKESRLLDRLSYGIGGVRARFGAMATGSGFSLGPEYYQPNLLRGQTILRVNASVSTKLWQLYQVDLLFPRLADGRAYLDLYGRHRNYAGLQYYGPGPDSRKTGRTAYRLEDSSADFSFGYRPVRMIRMGVTGGYLEVNTGPTSDRRFASTERVYSPAVTPGVDRQSDFLRGGVLLQLDTRDVPAGPRSGTNLLARFDTYRDQKLGLYSHRMLLLEGQQYVPFFHKRRVLAVRGRSILTFANPGQRVPFYLQPVLGGSDDLRGFRPYRFYGDNLLALNGEYRWEIFSGLDMALFADGGKVFQNRSEWNFHDLEGSGGFGFRFNVRNAVFMRVDVGFSREGYQVWLKFNNVF